MTTVLLQLSDLHIREPGQLAYGRINTAPFLEQAIASIGRVNPKPDAVVITGDLTDFGRPAEYAHLRNLLSHLSLPIYLLPGNHDDRDHLRAAFPDHAYLGHSGFVQFSVSVGGLQLIALDTVIPRAHEGGLCKERLAWLANELEAQSERPVVIAMHHPPFKTLIGHMDEVGLMTGVEALEAIVVRHPNVERVICGHLHRSIQVRFGGTLAVTVPSTAHQVSLDLTPGGESTWMLEPPGYGIHALAPGGRLVSHTATTGSFAGPYPFHQDSSH